MNTDKKLESIFKRFWMTSVSIYLNGSIAFDAICFLIIRLPTLYVETRLNMMFTPMLPEKGH